MQVLLDGVQTDVTWFIGLFLIALFIAIVSKSLIANLALIITAVLGAHFAGQLYGVTPTIQLTFTVIFYCVIAFALFQMIAKVEHL